MKRKLLLIYPPIGDDYYMVGVNDSPPLGLIAIDNFLRRNLEEELDIKIVDGEYLGKDGIVNLIRDTKFDFIGLQPMMASYENSIEIVKQAKQSGAITFFGGHHASQLAEIIMKNRYDILDYIIVGDGEIAVQKIIEGKKSKNIPNIVWWDGSKVITNDYINVDLRECEIDYINYDFYSIYLGTKKHKERGDSVSFRLYSHKGCQNRMNSQYCFFCGRADKGFRFKPVEMYLSEIQYLSENYNVDYIFEIGDDFLQNGEWLKELVMLKRKRGIQFNFELKIFARANRITPEIIPIFKELNITEVAIGFESGSEEILKKINKNCSASKNLEAAELLFSSGIDTIASYVIGLPGETDETLKETYNQAKKLVELSYKYLKKPPQEVIANLIEVNPGSAAYKKITERFPNKYLNKDNIKVKEAQDDYFRVFFGCETISEIHQLRKKFAKLSKK